MPPENTSREDSFLFEVVLFTVLVCLPVGKREPLDGHLLQDVYGDGPKGGVHGIGRRALVPFSYSIAPLEVSTATSTSAATATTAFRDNFFPGSRLTDSSLYDVAECFIWRRTQTIE